MQLTQKTIEAINEAISFKIAHLQARITYGDNLYQSSNWLGRAIMAEEGRLLANAKQELNEATK